jgi:site-specific DNA-methyltransferase (adenine-specific)
MNVFKSISDESINLIVTDPPYPTTKRGISKSTNTGGLVRSELGRKGKIFEYNNIDVSIYAPECYRVLKDGSHFYIMTNHVNLQHILNTCTDVGFHFIKSLIWNKGNKIMGQYYMSQFEYILFFRKGKGVKINNCGTPDILNVPNIKTKGKNGKNLHDTEKPVELMKILIENSSKLNDIVFDPFVGIGSTAMACLETNRKFICCELDTTYCDIANKRIQDVDIKIA